jgi:hypothetical protein
MKRRDSALCLVFKIVKRFSRRWKSLNGGANLMSLALEGCVFKDGILQPRESFQARAAAINLLPTRKGEFPQLSTQALQIAQHNVNAICPGSL